MPKLDPALQKELEKPHVKQLKRRKTPQETARDIKQRAKRYITYG